MRADLFPPHWHTMRSWALHLTVYTAAILPALHRWRWWNRPSARLRAALKLVDPVMADHGRPYASMTPEIRAAVAQLCGQADVIVPNATEAALLLEELPGPAGRTERTPPAMHPFCCSAFPRCAAPW